jgi:predicted protein tyrosine phosphatase
MSSIYVCNLVEIPEHAETLKVSHLVSLVSPDEQPPTPACIALERHHQVGIHDISAPVDGHILPAVERIEGLIEFVRAWQHDEAPILIHRVAGIKGRDQDTALLLSVSGPTPAASGADFGSGRSARLSPRASCTAG